ncbi:MAG: SdpI family protein [Saprospiraceae bacterium]|nr:SdpI family protein [Saprospiraceae bacterium]
MKLLSWRNLIIIVCFTAPFLYLNSVFDSLPENVALHYRADMQPDRFGPKEHLWTTLLIMGGVSFVLLLVILNMGKIDPKNQLLQSRGVIEKLALTLVIFFSLLGIYIVYAAGKEIGGNTIFVLLGGLFAVLGNLFHNIKPNYFIGIRMPWTLENPDNWRKTHQLGGKIWVVGGLLMVLISIFISPSYVFFVNMVILALMVLIPVVYSYRYYIAQKQKSL